MDEAPGAERDAMGAARGGALLALFLGSGATSLVYQILWVRELSLALGSTVYAISIVVSAFMGGLAIGSAWLGRGAERWGSGLRLYAWLEGGIGLCAFVLPWVFGRILALAAGLAPETALGGALPFVASFAALLVPTTLMGGTLPVLARFVSGFDTQRGVSIGLLYSLNTVGAVLGTALTGLVLVRILGIQTTTHLAAGGNFAICAVGLLLARRWPQREPQSQPAPAAPGPDARRGLLVPVTVVYCVNGFAGLALQLLWTRAFALFGTNTTYAFTVILTTYLLGLGIGSGIGSALVSRLRWLGMWLALLQTLIAGVAALTPLAMARFGLQLFGDVEAQVGATGFGKQVLSSGVLAALLMLPATLLMGACFPLVAQVVAGAGRGVGRRVGGVYALNTLGGVAGSLLAAFVLLPALGIERSILLCAGLLAASGLYLAWSCAARRTALAAATGLALCLALGLVASDHFRGMLASRLGRTLVFYNEGIETSVGVYESERAGRPVLVINNVPLADAGVVHKLLAHLPALLHPEPRRALVLGFGVGISSQSLSTHDLEVNDCVEISPGVIEAAPFFAALNGNIIERGDPAFRLFVADGRRLLLSPGEPYDIVVLDANSGNIRNAGVGKLYTREFFEVVKRRLSDDGIISLYVPLDSTHAEYAMVVRTFVEVFPHATLWLDRAFGETSVLLGSRQPLHVDVPRYLDRVLAPRVQADLSSLGLAEPGVLLSSFVTGQELLRVFASGGEINTDDRPTLEFFGLAEGPFAANDRASSDLGFWLHRGSVLPWLVRAHEHPSGVELLAFLEAEERVSHALFESGLHAWWGDLAGERAALRRAAGLHPEAEYLRARAGHGRELLANVEARARASRDASQLGQAGSMALSRGEYQRAADLYAAALERAQEGATGRRVRLGPLHFGRARAARAQGDLELARQHLDRAGGRGPARQLERAELALASGEAGTRIELNRRVGEAARRAGDWGRALEAYLALEADADREDLVRLGQVLERLGDPAGAYSYFRAAAASSGRAAPAAVAGAERARLELALRASVLREAFGARDPRAIPRSPFVTRPVSMGSIPVLDHRDPEVWLELSRLYLQARRPLLAYRMARSARTLAPALPAVYVAVGAAAEQLPFPGSEGLARIAHQRAQELDGH